MQYAYVVTDTLGDPLFCTVSPDTAAACEAEGDKLLTLLPLYGKAEGERLKIFYDKHGEPVAAMGTAPPPTGVAMPLQMQVADKHKAIEADWMEVR